MDAEAAKVELAGPAFYRETVRTCGCKEGPCAQSLGTSSHGVIVQKMASLRACETLNSEDEIDDKEQAGFTKEHASARRDLQDCWLEGQTRFDLPT